jgi:hypothetical protein
LRILPRVGKMSGARFAVCNALVCIGYSSSILIHSDVVSVLVVRDASLFMTPVGMAAKHASVCVLPRLRYFNIWFSFRCTLNCRLPSRDQYISISKNRK